MRCKLYVYVSLLLAICIVLTGVACRSEDRLDRSRELFSARQYAQCRTELQRLLSIDESNTEARLLLTKTELALGAHREALDNMVMLPLSTITQERIDGWYLDHLDASVQGEFYSPLAAIAQDDSKYAWSRTMLVRTAVALRDRTSLLPYLNQYADIIREDTDVMAQVWDFAGHNMDTPQFVCGVAAALGKEYETKLIQMLHSLDDGEIDSWLPEVVKSDNPDIILAAALLHGFRDEEEKGLELIIELEKNKMLPADSRLFSSVKYMLLFRLAELELTAAHLENMSLDDLVKLATYRRHTGDRTSYQNALTVINSRTDAHQDLVQKVLSPPPPPPKEVLIYGQPDMGYYSYNLSPDGKNLLWVDWEANYWWKSDTGEITKLDSPTNARSWSPDSKYVAQWISDGPRVILIRRASDLEVVGQVPWAGTEKVLGWGGDRLFIAATDMVYEYSISGEETAAHTIPHGFTPILSPAGALGFYAITDSEIMVKSDAMDKTFAASVSDVAHVLWLEDDAGLLIHSDYNQLWTRTKDTYYVLDFASGKVSDIVDLGESFEPMLGEYLWDGRTLYGCFTAQGNRNHLFRYDVISTQLDHTGIVLSMPWDLRAMYAGGVVEADVNIEMHKFK